MLKYIEFLFVLGITSIVANHSVQFLSEPNGQLITSSTLRWVHAENGVIPPNSVVGASITHYPDLRGNVYICRALHFGEWIPGHIVSGNKSCVVALSRSVYTYRVYEVLQNVDNSSRLSWVEWDFFHPPPPGMVAGSSRFYIARRKVGVYNSSVVLLLDGPLNSERGYNYLIGKLDPEYNYGVIKVITENENEKDLGSGEILVETEPINYELNNVTFNMARKKIRRERKALAMTILRNTVDVTMEVDSFLEYNFTYTSYWGQGSGILRGLRTLIRNNTGKILANLDWGIQKNEYRRELFKVASLLEPGTAVNITLYGNETRSEFPYTGTLVAFYKDGFKKSRHISGTRLILDMLDVKPVFGPIYFIGNNSHVPTTTTTTTSTTSTTTTTTTTSQATTLRATDPDYKSGEAQPSTLRENEIMISKNSIQANDMLSDDGALTLESKNKEDTGDVHLGGGNGSSAARTSTKILVVLSMLYISQNIT